MLTEKEMRDLTDEFGKKLESGYFKLDSLHNSEVNYNEKKENRDTAAVLAFLESDLAKHIVTLK